VCEELHKALARKELAATMKADEVLAYIHAALNFSPADFFEPSGRGGWLISQTDYRRLPVQVKRLITEIQTRSTITADGTETHKLWCKFVSKETSLTLAAKHQLGEKMTVFNNTFDWGSFLRGIEPLQEPPGDYHERVIEAALAAQQARAQGQALPPPSAPPAPSALAALTEQGNGNGTGQGNGGGNGTGQIGEGAP
jgi:hypothetical protein